MRSELNVLITGANRGIGLEFVRKCLKRGDTVTATARNVADATELNAEGVTVFALDVGSDESVASFKEALADWPVDLLINNAGVYGHAGMLNDLDLALVRRDFEVNTIGALRVMAAVRPNLTKGAKVVNITSKMGSISDNTSGGSYSYRISKTALNMATKCAAIELAYDDIIAIVMHPGWVQTDMGGPNALIDTTQSVEGMLSVIDALTPENAGSFWEWNGKEVGW